MTSTTPVRLFGTDGVRGRSNQFPMTAERVLQLGRASGIVFRKGEHRHTVLIGKDTRLSGYLFEAALQAGFTSMGVHTLLLGPLPTPAIAFLTRALRADAGVVISASHNAFEDNGIKFFGPDGMKLPDSVEREIETVLAGGDEAMSRHQPAADQLGRATRIEDAGGRYIEFCKKSFPGDLTLEGLRIVVDTAHGAAYRVARSVFWELGAEVITIGDQPDGLNINAKSGSLYPDSMRRKVLEVRADLGIALDGDADRLLLCDSEGGFLDGDSVLAMCALDMKRRGTLQGNGVVGTIMSNLGLEHFLTAHGISFVRTPVGDRPVLERMVADGINLGGEPSGHLIFLDHNTTGDGLIAALRVLALMVAGKEPLSKLGALFDPVPQVLRNVTLTADAMKRDPLESLDVREAIRQAEKKMGERGRLLVRKSGTEPKVRVMVEGDDRNAVTAMAEDLCAVIRKASSATSTVVTV